jgi:Cu/Ag efflux pump CusA
LSGRHLERKHLRRTTPESHRYGNLKRDLGAVSADVAERLKNVKFSLGYHSQLLGEYAERQAAQSRMLMAWLVTAAMIFLLLQMCFKSWWLAALVFLALPAALAGGILAAYAGDGIISLGALVGFLTVLGVAARNGILLISHFQHLQQQEGMPFGLALVLRGSRERLAPILMTTAATALALIPLVVAGDIPGHEVEHPMAVVILGGLVTSTLLNLFVVPVLYLPWDGATKSRCWDRATTRSGAQPEVWPPVPRARAHVSFGSILRHRRDARTGPLHAS